MPRTDLLLVTPFVCRIGGGVSESVRLLAHALSKRDDVAVEVVTLKTRYLEEDLSGWPSIPIHAFRAYGPRNFGFSPGMLWFLLKRKADVVHVHGIWMWHCLAAYLWSLKWDKPLVVSPHGMLEKWILARSPLLKFMVSRLYQDRFLRRASIIHVLTAKESQDVTDAVGHRKTAIIPNFVNIPQVSSMLPSWWEATMESSRIFLFLGRIHDKKGWRELCDAWDSLCNRDANFAVESYLLFCGWLDGCPDFEGVVGELGRRHGNACYVGPQYGIQKQATLSASHIFVLPSKSEGLPMVVLEAWASGLPVLMTDACNLDIGFTVGAAYRTGESVQEIEDALSVTKAWDSEKIAGMRCAARSLIESEFSEGVVGEQFVTLYRV